VKVADPGQTLADDVARVKAVRETMGPEGRIRVDANALWNVDQAERAIHALSEFDLEYVEQPVPSIDDMVEIRERTAHLSVPIAADESVRKATDPLAVARAGAADILIVKAQPLGGIHDALKITSQAGLPVVVSSAIDTSVGIAMGAYLAAAVPRLDFDCGLGTVALLESDVTDDPLLPRDGSIPVRRPEVSERALDALAASPSRREWWLARLARCHRLLMEPR
jgi:O-succinylbenzoate synthase